MADDLKRTPSQEARIDLRRDEDVRRWADEFGVTEEEIRAAVELVGPRLEDVRERLARNRSY